MNNSASERLGELAKLFLKLGVIGFGGPVAHIAMMEDEVVKQRQWLTRQHFLDLLGATNLIPGPNSTEMAIHVGYIYAGWWGLIVSGVCFILPAVLITGGLAWVYVTYGNLPQVAPLLYGIKPAVLAVIINALWSLGKKAVKTQKLLIIAWGVVALLMLLRLNEVVALLIGGVLGMIWLQVGGKGNQPGDRANFLNVSAVALMAVVTLQLGMATLTVAKAPFVDVFAVAIALISAVLVIRYKINAAWLVLGAGLMGWAAFILGYTP